MDQSLPQSGVVRVMGQQTVQRFRKAVGLQPLLQHLDHVDFLRARVEHHG